MEEEDEEKKNLPNINLNVSPPSRCSSMRIAGRRGGRGMNQTGDKQTDRLMLS